MPRYFCDLFTFGEVITDRDGTELANDAAAVAHARAVTLELMRNRERKTRSWRLRVRDADGRMLVEIPFVQIDPTLSHIDPHLRESMDRLALGTSRLGDSIRDVRASLLQVRGTMAGAGGLLKIVTSGVKSPV